MLVHYIGDNVHSSIRPCTVLACRGKEEEANMSLHKKRRCRWKVDVLHVYVESMSVTSIWSPRCCIWWLNVGECRNLGTDIETQRSNTALVGHLVNRCQRHGCLNQYLVPPLGAKRCEKCLESFAFGNVCAFGSKSLQTFCARKVGDGSLKADFSQSTPSIHHA